MNDMVPILYDILPNAKAESVNDNFLLRLEMVVKLNQHASSGVPQSLVVYIVELSDLKGNNPKKYSFLVASSRTSLDQKKLGRMY